MVRKKSRPSFFSETQCQENTWSLTGVESSSCEFEVLNLLEKSRVLAAESAVVHKTKTKDEKSSPRKRPYREACADISNCYLEEVLSSNETSLTAACVIKLYIRARESINFGFNLIKLRERQFKLKSISSIIDMREMLITHEKQVLLYDFVDDLYSLRSMTDKDPSNVVSFSLVDSIYPDLQVFQAAVSLSKLSALFICLFVDQRRECVVIEEFLNGAFAADTEASDVPRKVSKAMTVRKLTHFKVFLNYMFGFSDEDLNIANSEQPESIDPEYVNDILSLSQTHRGKDYFRTEDRDQSTNLLPKLRPYQIAASKWMLEREQNPVQCFTNKLDQKMHPMYRKVSVPVTGNYDCCEHTMFIYVNIFSGSFHVSPPACARPVAGGVIADEMGLGKTLEVLEVILRNARPLDSLSSPISEKYIEFQNVMLKFREGTDEKLQLGGADNIELSCVCGVVDFDEGDVATIRKLGVPVKCNECSSWLHPYCMNIKQTTVEIQTNRVRPTRKKVFLTPENYICPFCVVQRKTLVKVPATLVISPASICDQWCEEINKHVEEGALKVLVYKGVRSKQKFMQPEDFLKYDVVITTFEVLRAELNHSDLHDDNTESPSKRSNVPQQALLEADPHPCRLRKAKRYRSLPTPLVCVEWWRICVDEAQTIEAHTAKATEMLLKLHCVNRWCVTGTIIHRNVEDLFGVMLFLQVDPLNVRFWWNEFVKKKLNPSASSPFAPSELTDDKIDDYLEDKNEEAKCSEIDCTVLLQALRCFVWRTCKKDVRDQIAIPTQYIHIRKLKFSPIEAHFYNMKKKKCAKKAHSSAIWTMDSSSMLNQIDKAAAKKVLTALSELRKACVHPQMVHGHTIGGLNNKNGRLMTMEELLAEMKVKAVRECEESLRQICCSINGIAGVEILMNNSLKAVELYREVLRLTTAYAAEGIRSDYLPKIHTLYNLHLVLNSLPEGMVEPTPRDSELMTECNKLKLEYLTAFDKDTEAAKVKWVDTRDKITSLRQQFDSNSWLADLCASVLEDNLENLLVEKVYADLQKNEHTMSESFRNIVGLEYYVYTNLEKILTTREKCCRAVQSLNVVLSDQIVSSCYECHLKPENNSPSQVGQKKPVKRPKCTHCKVHDSLIEYENLIFGSALQTNLPDSQDWDADLVDDSEAVTGNEDNPDEKPSTSSASISDVAGTPKSEPEKWNPSRVEIICNAISAFAETYAMRETDVKSSKFVRNMFELLKREFKFLRSFWRCLTDRVSAHDELRMATDRIRLLNKDEDPKVLNQAPSNILHPHMLPQTHKRLQNELCMFETELMERRGRKAYLANLDKAKNLNRNTELCPVCRSEFDKQWSVFACGHSFCLRCVGILLDDPQHSNASSFDDLAVMTMSSRRTKVKCPVCRQVSPLATISYVKTQRQQQSQLGVQFKEEGESCEELEIQPEVEVKGDLSAKTHAIVETIVSTLKSEPLAKFLVFSTWLEVLNILSSALEMNHVPHLTLTPGYTFKTVLTKFKCGSSSGENQYPVMLMQYKSSSSGLNIIEANHVIIVEPVLTPAVVHQAIGRVDRISQTRETHVHLFIIEDTVEDQICKLTTQFKENSSTAEVSRKATTPAISLKNIKQMFD